MLVAGTRTIAEDTRARYSEAEETAAEISQKGGEQGESYGSNIEISGHMVSRAE